jgi:hypothetical protein
VETGGDGVAERTFDSRAMDWKDSVMPWRSCLAAALLLIGLVAPVLAASGGVHHTTSPAACSAVVHHDVLPVWLRGGFSGPKPRVPYVLGKHGSIAGVLFGAPLNAPPAASKNNKILWVPRHYAKKVAPLWIKLQKMDGTRLVGAPVRRIIASGPGPSYVDAPSAGCWRLTLTWSGRSDTLDLEYVPPTN